MTNEEAIIIIERVAHTEAIADIERGTIHG